MSLAGNWTCPLGDTFSKVILFFMLLLSAHQVTVSTCPIVHTVSALGVMILGTITSLLISGVACTTVTKARLLAIAKSIVRVSKTNMVVVDFVRCEGIGWADKAGKGRKAEVRGGIVNVRNEPRSHSARLYIEITSDKAGVY